MDKVIVSYTVYGYFFDSEVLPKAICYCETYEDCQVVIDRASKYDGYTIVREGH
jgi:hypothetical protein